MSEKSIILLHASELLTGAGIRAKDGRHPKEEDLGRIPNGALVYSTKTVSYTDFTTGKSGKKVVGDKILWVGESEALPSEYSGSPVFDLYGRNAIMPGLIDCHTHLVFAGNRASEFAARCGGASYADIAASGGGIQTTVNATRNATEEELFRLARARVEDAHRYGIRTIEAKSGYGLSLETELKILRVVKRLQEATPELEIIPTFLGAHDFPKGADREAYLIEILDEQLPAVAREGLANVCDVFIDEGYYTVEEAERILTRAKQLGMKTKVHADELVNTESAAFAADIGALSADHLLKISPAGIAALAASETTAVLLPGTAFYLKTAHAPARALIDAGARVAISTDLNPGTSMTSNLPAVLTISALYLGLTRAELFAAVTYNAARALDVHSRKGTLEAGMDADFFVTPYATFEELYYRFAW
ncbi:MAG: imidazolonepropionase [Cryobacterium sp.]|nr:imidazolonepropionase [Oligoflexia bacterium]